MTEPFDSVETIAWNVNSFFNFSVVFSIPSFNFQEVIPFSSIPGETKEFRHNLEKFPTSMIPVSTGTIIPKGVKFIDVDPDRFGSEERACKAPCQVYLIRHSKRQLVDLIQVSCLPGPLFECTCVVPFPESKDGTPPDGMTCPPGMASCPPGMASLWKIKKQDY